MKSSTRFFIIIAAALAFSTLLTAQKNSDRWSVEKNGSFKIGSGGKLVLTVENGDVRIIPWDKKEVAIRAMSDDEDDFEDLKMDLRENTVRVTNYSSCSSCDIQYEVSVPKEFDLKIETSAGNINIQSGLSGELTGRTSAGDIKLGSLGGTIEMKTSGGNIKCGDSKGDLRLVTSGGDIIVGKVSGVCDVQTSGGDIKVEQVGKTLDAQTAGGDVRIGDVGGEATVSTSGGTIIVGKVAGKASLTTAGGDIEIASATGTVTAKTAGGNLDLDNITGSIIARTAGGDVVARLVPSGKGKSKLTTAAGDIKLYIPEHAKATINARIRVQGRWGDDDGEYHIKSDFKSDNYSTNEDDGDITATYTLNGGGEVISLETSNADIYIRKMLGGEKSKR
jgi:DUF4097 and DUF4098 domain-containing protein YvlB